jgi:hypothetical protein
MDMVKWMVGPEKKQEISMSRSLSLWLDRERSLRASSSNRTITFWSVSLRTTGREGDDAAPLDCIGVYWSLPDMRMHIQWMWYLR